MVITRSVVQRLRQIRRQGGNQSVRARRITGFLIHNTTHFLICAFVTELAYWLTVVIVHFRQLFSRYIRFLHGLLSYKYSTRYFCRLHHKRCAARPRIFIFQPRTGSHGFNETLLAPGEVSFNLKLRLAKPLLRYYIASYPNAPNIESDTSYLLGGSEIGAG